MAQTDSYGVQFSDDWRTLTKCPDSFSGGYEIPVGTTSIGPNAFKDCLKLTSLTIPRTVTSIQNGAFTGCKSLNDIYYSGDIDGWMRIDISAFAAVGYKLWLPGENREYQPLKGLVIPESITEIKPRSFYYCRNVGFVKFHPNITKIGDSAFNKSGLSSSLWLPDNLTSIGEYAFFCCHSMTNVIIKESLSHIGPNAFAYCSQLFQFSVDENNSYFSTDENGGLLYDKFKTHLIQCAGKKSFSSPMMHVARSCKTIADSAFWGCGEMTVYLPKIEKKVLNVKDCKCDFRVPYGTKESFVELGFPRNQLTELYDWERLIRTGEDHLKLVSENPFRVLGVLANASAKEIAASSTKIKRFAMAGKAISSATDFNDYLGEVHRTPEAIDEALAKINLPKDKLRNALFWFVSFDETDKKALDLIASKQVKEAIDLYFEDDNYDRTTSKYNLAVFDLIREKWRLNDYANDILTFIKKDEYRNEFVQAICGDNLVLSKEELSHIIIDSLLEECDAQQLYLMYNDSYGQGEAAEYVKEKVIGTYVSLINSAISSAKGISQDKPEENLKAAKKLIETTKEAIAKAREFLPENDPQYTVIADALAKQIQQSTITFYNGMHDEDAAFPALEVQKYATSLASSDLVKQRCQENEKTLREIVFSLPPVSCKTVDAEIKNLLSDKLFLSVDSVTGFLLQGARLIVKVKTLKEDYAKTSDDIQHYDGYITNVATAIGEHALDASIDLVNSGMKRKVGDDLISMINVAWKNMCYIGSLPLNKEYRTKRFDPNNKTLGELYDKANGLRYGGLSLGSRFRSNDRLDLRSENEVFNTCSASEQNCDTYLSKFPDGKYKDQVLIIKEEFVWKTCKTIESYRKFLKQFSSGVHSSEAKKIVDEYDSTCNEINNTTSLDKLAADYYKYQGTYFEPIIDERFFGLCASKEDCQKYVQVFKNGKYKEKAQKRSTTPKWLWGLLT